MFDIFCMLFCILLFSREASFFLLCQATALIFTVKISITSHNVYSLAFNNYAYWIHFKSPVKNSAFACYIHLNQQLTIFFLIDPIKQLSSLEDCMLLKYASQWEHTKHHLTCKQGKVAMPCNYSL